METPEIYADKSMSISMTQDGKLAKITFVSERVQPNGNFVVVPVMVLTMHTDGLRELLKDLQQALGVNQAQSVRN